jgi:peptidyl-prolyl cis-trans isomerase D
MEAFRRLIRGWLGKVLLVIFLIPFALVGIEGYFSGMGKEQTAIKVNKTKISQTALDAAVENQRKQLLGQVQGDETQLNETVIKKLVTDSLISRALLLEQAKTLGFELSDQQIGQLIRQEPSFQENGQYSETLFQTYLKTSGTSLNQLLNDVREQVAIQQLAGGISDTGLSSKKEIDRLAILQTEKRSVHIASLPLSSFATGTQVTAQQIAAYYNKNKAQFSLPESVDVNYTVLDRDALAGLVQVTEADIQAQYNSLQTKSAGAEERHIQHILIEVNNKTTDAAAKQQLAKAAARIKAGEDFGKVASEVSQDAGSAANQGDLGFLAKGSFPGAFDDTAFSLAINQVSAPVRSDAGYHLIKVTEIKKDAVANLESMRPQLTAQAQQAKLDELYGEAVNSLNDMAVETDSLQELAKAQRLTISTANTVTKQNTIEPLNSADVKAALFNEDVIHGDRKVSTGIELAPGKTIWVKVTNYHPPRAQTLAEATVGIRQTLELQAWRAKAEAKAKVMIEAFKRQAPAQVQQANNVSLQSIGEVSRMSGAPVDLQRIAFSLPKPKAGQWSAGYYVQDGNLILVAISDVVVGTVDGIPADQRQQLVTTLAGLRGQQELADYALYLKSNAKVKIETQTTKQDTTN